MLALWLALAILGVGAGSEAAAQGLQARLVNKKPVGEAGPVSFYVGQVEVTLADGAKKLLPHWSYMEPQVVGDRVLVLPTDGVKLTRVFIFDAKTGKPSTFRFPFDLDLYFGSPSFSPDGTKLAYYHVKEGKVLVRAWPSLKLIKQSDKHPVRPTQLLASRESGYT